jgi:glycosyltransferase involved in cell wall biosynthesis
VGCFPLIPRRLSGDRRQEPFEGSLVPAPLHVALLDYRDISHPEAGGAETYLHEIFQRVAAHGHRVTLVCARHGRAPAEDRIGDLRVIRVGSKATVNFAAARAALALSAKERVDLFVENLCKIPFLLPLFTRTPVLPVVHHLFGHTVFQETNPAFASYVWLYEKLIPPVYRGLPFVAVSESTAADLARRGVRASRMDVVRNGLDLKRYHILAPPPREAAPLVLYLGRLKRYKGIDTVLDAFARVRRAVPAARFVLVGRGDDRPRLERRAARLGLQGAVAFQGFVPEDEKIAWLRRAHVLVYPSPREGWGISAVEAAACGTPVVASDAEGLREAVRPGETGFLVPHRDADAWADRLIALLSDPALRARMEGASRAWAERFDWDREAETMRRIIEEIAGGAAAGGKAGGAR